jgi:phage baseplate assembly protein W/3D (Asp-Asp-Asp) domain-containing protein
MRYTRYVISAADTLEGLAQTYLGSASRAAEIASLNHLRYPFISQNPQDKLAGLLGSTQTTAAISNGTILSVTSADPALFPDGGIVYLRGVGGVQGQHFHDTLVIQGTARAIGGQRPLLSAGLQGQTSIFGKPLPPGDSIVFSGGLAHSYAAGTFVWGYPDQAAITTLVVAAGDTILLPIDAGASNTLSATEGDLVAALGIDLALDRQGFLSLTNGDFTMVAGAQTIDQAIRIRLATQVGELAAHPDYGDEALAVLGSGGSDVGVRIYAGIIAALLADPRVARVQNLLVQRAGDAVVVTCAVAIRDRDAVVSINNLVLSLQG